MDATAGAAPLVGAGYFVSLGRRRSASEVFSDRMCQ
jgi:hypothetical protein